jgi:hypothetical protein
MRENNNQTSNSAFERSPLQVVQGKRKTATSSAVCINQHVKKCIHRLVFHSDLEISSLRQVARLAGVTGPRSEAKVLDVIRETVREAMRPLPPDNNGAMWPQRRMAA